MIEAHAVLTALERDELMSGTYTLTLTEREKDTLMRAISLASAVLCADALHFYQNKITDEGDNNVEDMHILRRMQSSLTVNEAN